MKIKRQIILALLTSLLFLSFPVQGEEEYNVTPVSGTGKVISDVLNVRSGPGKEYDPPIAKVKKGQEVVITGETDNDWYQIQTEGQSGYVSASHVELMGELTIVEPEDGGEEEIGEPEEGWKFYENPRFIKTIAVILVIAVVAVALFFTLRGIRRGDNDDDGDMDDDDDNDDGTDEDDDMDDEEEIDGPEEDEDEGDEIEIIRGRERAKGADRKRPAKKQQTVIIREEDYQLHIDPKYFENTTQIEQPQMVTGYLEKKKLEAELEAAAAAGKEKELEAAMQKLNELQAEIERLKRSQ